MSGISGVWFSWVSFDGWGDGRGIVFVFGSGFAGAGGANSIGDFPFSKIFSDGSGLWISGIKALSDKGLGISRSLPNAPFDAPFFSGRGVGLSLLLCGGGVGSGAVAGISAGVGMCVSVVGATSSCAGFWVTHSPYSLSNFAWLRLISE